MEEINVGSIQSTVLWATFAVGLAFGAISHRTHFCTMGAVADVFNFGDWNRMRMWIVAISVATLGLQGMSLAGLANLNDTIYLNNQWSWLSGILGGVMFGAGMVLASGCGSKTLIRLGAGNLKALMVFVIMGISAYMTLRGVFGVLRANYLDPVRFEFESSAYLPDLLSNLISTEPSTISQVLAIALPLLLLIFALANKSAWNKEVILGGVGVGLTVLAAWWVIFQMAYIPEHPDTLEAAYLGSYANRAEGFSFVAPYAFTLEWLMFFSDQSRVLTVGVVACFGVILGAAASALTEKSFRWETFQGVEDTANHTVGAVLMGVGGVLALGCTVGQGLSGVSTLSLASWVALFSIVLGAMVALKYQMWRVERMI
ncbi:YeeE/YedE family protein [Limnobacter parvus]|uniref:YeeE/YedE family protein n=1 Tax=Limnobacter parvus TaxID=2939690 RepID=A0ABT1XGB3_9BURK|nr:YeeE/YedE family protein [Limnobacter parvus]MCR2746316.1 YeeE/YedE family protein [Limnobacter parvus]